MRDFFNKLYNARYETKILETKIKEKKNALYSIKGITYDKELSKTNTNKDLASMFAEIDELEEELQKSKDKVSKLELYYREEIKKITDNVKDQTILRMYYINNFKIYQIAFMFDYSERQTMRIKRKADEKIKKYIKNVM